MTNIMTFSILTDAPYSEDEREGLLEALTEFISTQDGDVNVDSADLDVIDTIDAEKQAEAKKKEIIQNFLEKASIAATVSVSLSGDELASVDLSE